MSFHSATASEIGDLRGDKRHVHGGGIEPVTDR